ncbi:hepatocyte growth factor receptor, partial [Biomphalaria pfeifferi]
MKPKFRTVYTTVFILAIFFVLSLEQNISSLDLGQNITQITYDVSYNVYIGGYNFIAKVSSKFKLVSSKVSIGPVFEDWNCPDGSAPCDNIVQTLQVLQEIQMLLVCGSAFNGTCTLHRLTDLTNWSCLISDPITSGGLATSGSQVTSIQWLGVASSNHLDTMNTKEHCRPDNFVENRHWSSQDHELSFDQTNSTNDSYTIFKLMVAQFGHPEYFIVSVRHIISSFSHYLMKYETDRQSIPKILQINTTYRTEQKFSFTETNWTFYIIVGQDTSMRTDVTKLIRLSNDMVQVVEVILTCIHNKTTYPTLTSAVMATMGVLINTKFNAGPVLIASFTRATSVPTRTRHVLCVFSIYDINIKITQELSIEVEPIEETAVLPLQRPVNQIFTFSTSQEKQPTDTLDVFLVDDTFAIYKVGLKVIFRQTRHMFENTSIVSHVLKLDTRVGHWKHVTAGVVDQSKARLYISIGTKVLKLSFDFCRQFDNCQECNENACLWCPDEKLCFDTRHGALSCNWTTEYICKPSITSIRPSEVPIQGGTLLSIHGTGFGINSSRVSVTICNQSCDEAVLKNKAITCRVQARSVCDHCNETCEVQFIQYDDQYNQTKYTSESNDKVKIIYVSPQIQSFSPHFGPVSGGYWLQFKGHHLSAGDNTSVQVVGRECLNITRN